MRTKRIVALVLSVIMLLSCSVTAYGFYQQNGFNYERINATTNVEIIGIAANGELSGVSSITIPKTLNGSLVTTIGMSAFYSNNTITNVVFPETLNVISDSAFYCAGSLKTITFPKELKYLGRASFAYCVGLTSVTFDTQKLTGIESNAFFGCTALNNVILPNEIFNIDDYAFANCTALRNIYIPSNVAIISDKAFDGVDNLTIYGSKDSNAHYYALENNINFVSVDDINKITLNDWIDAVGYTLNGDNSLYIENTIKNLREKYNIAVAVRDNFFSVQSEIDNALTELENAYYALKLKSMVQLEEKVKEAQRYIADASLYTESSINNLKSAIDSANKIINKPIPSQKEVNTAINNIDFYISLLIFKSEEDLRNIVELSRDVLENNSYKYTSESINALKIAYDSVLLVLDDVSNYTNEELVAACSSVKKAYNALNELMKGDLDGDNKVTIKDAVITQKHILGIKEFNEEQSYVADFNNDGKVSIADSVLIQRHIIGI